MVSERLVLSIKGFHHYAFPLCNAFEFVCLMFLLPSNLGSGVDFKRVFLGLLLDSSVVADYWETNVYRTAFYVLGIVVGVFLLFAVGVGRACTLESRPIGPLSGLSFVLGWMVFIMYRLPLIVVFLRAASCEYGGFPDHIRPPTCGAVYEDEALASFGATSFLAAWMICALALHLGHFQMMRKSQDFSVIPTHYRTAFGTATPLFMFVFQGLSALTVVLLFSESFNRARTAILLALTMLLVIQSMTLPFNRMALNIVHSASAAFIFAVVVAVTTDHLSLWDDESFSWVMFAVFPGVVAVVVGFIAFARSARLNQCVRCGKLGASSQCNNGMCAVCCKAGCLLHVAVHARQVLYREYIDRVVGGLFGGLRQRLIEFWNSLPDVDIEAEGLV